MIGHPQGASGAAGIVATALALSRGFLPPTINSADPDPRCDLDFIPNHGRAAEPERRCATAWDSDRRTARWCSGAAEAWPAVGVERAWRLRLIRF